MLDDLREMQLNHHKTGSDVPCCRRLQIGKSHLVTYLRQSIIVVRHLNGVSLQANIFPLLNGVIHVRFMKMQFAASLGLTATSFFQIRPLV